MIRCTGVLLLAAALPAQDWTTYRADNARSAIAASKLSFPLQRAWVWQPRVPPAPAWPRPAKRDAYNKVENMVSRHAFDPAFHVVAAEGRVFFGSTGDDQVRCLDAASGKELWTFFTEAPVRAAPTIDGKRLLFGSDDGHVYCIDAMSGKLQWKQRPSPEDHRVPGNGRMMSVWPVRSGVVVQGSVAYCAAGLFASEGSYLCALDARTGRSIWQHRRTDLHPQGHMLASQSSLYLTTGRGKPIVFERKTGKLVKKLGGQGGTFALLTGDSLISGPGKTGQLAEHEGRTRDHIATFGGLHMIVRRGVAYLHSATELSMLDRTRYLSLLADKRKLVKERDGLRKEMKALQKKGHPQRSGAAIEKRLAAIGAAVRKLDGELPKCFRWRRSCDLPDEMILAGDVLLLGGDGQIAGFSVADGKELWRAKVDGRVFGLAVADGRLLASCDNGNIYCFARG